MTVASGLQCFVVATLASMTPAVPFIFRNYEYSPDSQAPRASAPPNDEASLYELGGSSKHLVWQAVRASSAAPYYLDDFVCGPDRYGTAANCSRVLVIIMWASEKVVTAVSCCHVAYITFC